MVNIGRCQAPEPLPDNGKCFMNTKVGTHKHVRLFEMMRKELDIEMEKPDNICFTT